MAAKHPYVSTTGVLTQVLDQLQKSFPAKFNAETLKKLGFAPNNESYIVNVARFLKLITDDDSKTDEAQKVFTQHDPEKFQAGFSQLVEVAYADLFNLHKDAAWTLQDDKLIPFFRQTDQTSELVGTRQANTFRTLAAYAGHGEKLPTQKVKKTPSAAAKSSVVGKKPKIETANKDVRSQTIQTSDPKAFGLTVRVEINLPATGDQNTYDKIFKSIRENLLNG